MEVGHFWWEANMVVSEGYFYHIKDESFIKANESSLMSNYENEIHTVQGNPLMLHSATAKM